MTSVGLEFMALYLLGLDLIFLTGHSVWNAWWTFTAAPQCTL